MQTIIDESTTTRLPGWLWTVSVIGIVWNLYGVYQFVGTCTLEGRTAMTAGMTSSQAALYLTLPIWISVAFAAGVLGGLFGSILLALRRLLARHVLAASLIGYGLLFIGDTYYRIFAAIPRQLGILAVVVFIATVMLWASLLAGRRGLLR